MSKDNVISLTVPMSPQVLKRASEFFNALAADAAVDHLVAQSPDPVPHVVAPPAAAPVAPVYDPRDNDGDAPDPVVAPPAAAPNPGGVEIDKFGLPWDERIHSSSRNKNADGSWRQKRNLDKQLLANVEAGLRAAMSAPAAPPVVDPVATFAPPVVTMPADAAVPPVAAAAFSAPPAMIVHPSIVGFVSYDNGATWVPAPAVAAVATIPAGPGATATIITPPAAAPVVDFPSMMARITDMAAKGKTDNARIEQSLGVVGVPAIPNLVARPDLIPAFIANLEKLAGL